MTTQARVMDALARVGGIDTEKFDFQSKLEEDVGLDSLDVIEFAMELEDDFGFEITSAEEDQWRTIGDVVRFLDKRMAKP